MPPLAPYSLKSRRFIRTPPQDQAFINILEGSIRSGKTWTMIPKILQLCKHDAAGERIMTGISKDTVYHNILKDLFEAVGKKNHSYNRQSGEMHLFGIPWRVVGAKDEGSEKYIRGATVGAAYCDEATLMPESFWKMLLGRMSDENARLYATTNPDTPFHYLKTEYLDPPELRASGYVWSEHFTMDDNLSLTPKVRARYEAMYKGFFFLRFIRGLWIVAEGAIYKDSWSDDLLYDDSDCPVGLYGAGGYYDRIVAVDYGTTNPCVFLEGIDDGTTVWIDREMYWDSSREMRQKTDAEYADDMIQFLADSRVSGKAPRIVVDPSAASFKAELSNRGLMVVDANNDVLDGIRRVSSVMGQRKIRVHRGCENLRREVEAYSWDKKAAQRGEEKPVKQNDHAMDAKRYLIAELFPEWRLAA